MLSNGIDCFKSEYRTLPGYIAPENIFPDHVQLHLNENFYGPSPKVIEVLGNIIAEDLHFYPGNGNQSLITAIAKRTSLASQNIFINNGASAIIQQILQSLVLRDKVALVLNPSWNFYQQSLLQFGAQIEEFDLAVQDDHFVLDLDGFIDAIHRHEPQLVILCSPNNPCSSALSYHQISQICDAQQYGIVLLDEAYKGLSELAATNQVLLHDFNNVIIIRSFSKLYALAGVRVGYGLASVRIAQMLRQLSPEFGVSYIAQQLAIAALSDQAYYQMIAEKIRSSMLSFKKTLSIHSEWTVFRSQSNFFLLHHKKYQGKEVAKYLYEQGFIVKPVSILGDANYIRLCVADAPIMQRVAESLLLIDA